MSKDTVTVAEARALTRAAGGKFNARRTWVPELERWFSSAHEAEVAVTLRRRERAGEIRDLAFQVPFDLAIHGERICRYVADFCWLEPRTLAPWATGNPADDARVLWDVLVVGDAKAPPTRTAVYRIKAKLMRALHGVRIVEL